MLAAAVAVAGPEPAKDDQISRPTEIEQVALLGDVPTFHFPNIQQRSEKIWAFLMQRLNLPNGVAAPVIYFQPFDKAVQSREWTKWQKGWTQGHVTIWRDWTAMRSSESAEEITQEWIDANIDDVFPFPDHFLAFHYDGTNRIQINPNRTFRASVRQDPYGMLRDLDGFGYYTVGHEMLHYALEIKGVVPTKLHHCLILHTDQDEEMSVSLMDELAAHLVDDGMLAPISRHRGLHAERLLRPCERLTSEELEHVAHFHGQLDRR